MTDKNASYSKEKMKKIKLNLIEDLKNNKCWSAKEEVLKKGLL